MLTTNRYYCIEKIKTFSGIDLEAALTSFDYCNKNKISVGLEPLNLYVTFQRCVAKVYGHGGLLLSMRKDGSVKETDYFVCAFPEAESIFEDLVKTTLFMIQSAYLLDTGGLKVKRSRRGNSEVIICKNPDFIVRRYDGTGDSDFIVNEKANDPKTLVITDCEFWKKTYTIPSRLYPMPNNNWTHVFTAECTKPLNDDGALAEILNTFSPKLGCCYQNVADAIKLLDDSGYTQKHTVRFFSGWAIISGIVPTHHAWLVVDGNSVFDFAINKLGLAERARVAAEKGEYIPLSRELLAKDIRKMELRVPPFMERFPYGQCFRAAYVGVESNRDEALASYQRLMKEFPDHPSYKNLSKTSGVNKLNEIYYGIGD